jgi:hypothetical protein
MHAYSNIQDVNNNTDAGVWDLIISLRDTPHLVYLNTSTYIQRFISLNEASWDLHCSFTPLFMVRIYI